MSNDSEQIQAEIEVTRAELSRDVDALAQSVRPANVARRQKTKVRGAMSRAKDTVMGATGSVKETVVGRASDAQSATGNAIGSTGEVISSAPTAARQRAQGNPMAVGLIALGAGWLAGSLLPASKVERQAVDTLKEKAGMLTQEVTGIAKETAQNLQEPAKEALDQVKSTGMGAVETVKEETKSTGSDVAGTAKEGVQNVKQSSQSG
jgi:hypothetical protein